MERNNILLSFKGNYIRPSASIFQIMETKMDKYMNEEPKIKKGLQRYW